MTNLILTFSLILGVTGCDGKLKVSHPDSADAKRKKTIEPEQPQVQQSKTSFSYDPLDQKTVVGSSFDISPSMTHTAAVKVTIAPPLPTGLSIDQSSGRIFGVPTSISRKTDYIVTAAFQDGTTLTSSISIEVTDIAPTGIRYAASEILLFKGEPMAAMSPSIEGFHLSASVDTDNSLPDGILLDPSSGKISGTPVEVSELKTYTISARNSGGAATVDMHIVVAERPNYNASHGFTVNVAGAAISPNIVDSVAATWSITPQLPPGLTLDPKSGVITGASLTKIPESTFSITADFQVAIHTSQITITVEGETLDLSSFASLGTLSANAGWGSAQIVGDRLYLFGGNNYNYSVKDAVQYAELSDLTTWNDAGFYLPYLFWMGESFIANDRLYLVGNIEATQRQSASAPLSDLTDWTDHGDVLPGSGIEKGTLDIIGDDLYLFAGEDAPGNLIYRGSLSEPTTWVDTGKTLPTHLGGASYFRTAEGLYFIKASGSTFKVYRAEISDPTAWTHMGDTPNLGSTPSYCCSFSIIVGDRAYIIGGFENGNIYSSPISNMLAWTDTGIDMPTGQGCWGGDIVRVDNAVYILGGLLHNDWRGLNRLLKIDIITP